MDSHGIIQPILKFDPDEPLEKPDPELSIVNAKTGSLILGCGNQAAMLTVLERQRDNLEGRKEIKVLRREDEARTMADIS
ncbi:hypothetical protein llap_3700 [Limosa lapponica baueri]|uniref:Uncharacterized protein n=1 Tax=Limosa lapponica baueri TaxID=1758121 RepID=A0A2I0UIX1_LIMLA|nr:hypothetical protein llap_3700 [Limosa lapponica baueri]